MDHRQPELSEAEFDVADRIEAVLEGTDQGLTASAAGRKAHTDTATARRVLDYLAAHQYVVTSGNGIRTHYHARRGA